MWGIRKKAIAWFLFWTPRLGHGKRAQLRRQATMEDVDAGTTHKLSAGVGQSI